MAFGRTLLLASDLTARSDRPTDRAFLLAQQLRGSVVLLHVIDKGDEARLEEQTREALEAVVGHISGSVEVQVRFGEVPREILDLAAERNPTLIITGVARFNSVRDYLLGTAVDHLVRHSPVPVLVVKRRALRPYQRILVATDFSDCSKHALETSAALFPEAAITLWHGCHAGYEAFLNKETTEPFIHEQATGEMASFVASADLPVGMADRLSQIVDLGELSIQLDQALKCGDYDLLVLGTHGRGGFAHAMIGSRASEMLQDARSDVLLIRGGRQ